MRRGDVRRRVDEYGCRVSDMELDMAGRFVEHCAGPGFGYGAPVFDDDVRSMLGELERAKRRHAKALWTLVRKLEPERRRRFLMGARCLRDRSHACGSMPQFLCDTIEWLCRERDRIRVLMEFLKEPGVL